jgi:hypothetical protein
MMRLQACFPNIVHVSTVEEITAGDLRPLLQRREVSGILVGGGSRCQGNSFGNPGRKGLRDPRSNQPLCLKQLAADLALLPEVKKGKIPVIQWLENVASAPPQVKKEYNKWMQTSRVLIRAARFGYTERNRCLWARSQWEDLQHLLKRARMPKHAELVGGSNDESELVYKGQPVPKRVQCAGGFQQYLWVEGVAAGKAKGMFPFTREFWRKPESDPKRKASKEALERFFTDNQRFNENAYETNCMPWKGEQCRQYLPEERAAMHGLPTRNSSTGC